MAPGLGFCIGGKYEITRPLARGGMGTVWAARHTALDREVAVKLMAADIAEAPAARARFEREARAAAALRSPHVVDVYDYGVEDDVPYMVMELLDGEDLGARLARTGTLPVAEVARLVAQTCRALEAAHDAGIVHRDLKPENIFLCRGGEGDLVKLLDFGVAKQQRAPSVTRTTHGGAFVGSPAYMSPEQIRKSSSVDHRTDLWALGVVAFRALTGRLPFDGEEVGELFVKVCIDPVPVPSQIAPALGPEVDAFVARALARSPVDRFQSAREMAEASAALCEAKHAPSPPTLPDVAAPSRSTLPDVAAPARSTLPDVAAEERETPSRSTLPDGAAEERRTPSRSTLLDVAPPEIATLTGGAVAEIAPRSPSPALGRLAVAAALIAVGAIAGARFLIAPSSAAVREPPCEAAAAATSAIAPPIVEPAAPTAPSVVTTVVPSASATTARPSIKRPAPSVQAPKGPAPASSASRDDGIFGF